VKPGVSGPHEVKNPEVGDTSFCIAAFGALNLMVYLIPPVAPGVINVSPLRGYAKPGFNLKITYPINQRVFSELIRVKNSFLDRVSQLRRSITIMTPGEAGGRLRILH
jgi:hypothetical protein